ncbi:MAG TPA: hypothetical protein VFS08_20675 [Gemmatimonadaceae bacterium]|nr:hypothetical protein [Gemmatimonadaceae bacterium]
MRRTHVLAGALATLPTLQPPIPHQPPAPPPTARLFVVAARGAGVHVDVSAPGGRLRLTAPGAPLAADVSTTTPAVVEVYGSPTELRVQSAPEHPLRVQVLMPAARSPAGPAAYHGWHLQLRRTERGYVPATQIVPLPSR